MKRKYLKVFIIFLFIVCSILSYLYLRGADMYKRVDIYTSTDFKKDSNIPIISITDNNTLRDIATIVRKADKIQGILNVAPPKYILELYGLDESLQTMYLWIAEDDYQGMYMYKDKSETGHTISEGDNRKLKKIIETGSK